MCHEFANNQVRDKGGIDALWPYKIPLLLRLVILQMAEYGTKGGLMPCGLTKSPLCEVLWFCIWLSLGQRGDWCLVASGLNPPFAKCSDFAFGGVFVNGGLMPQAEIPLFAWSFKYANCQLSSNGGIIPPLQSTPNMQMPKSGKRGDWCLVALPNPPFYLVLQICK
jgi:hypothetical protein